MRGDGSHLQVTRRGGDAVVGLRDVRRRLKVVNHERIEATKAGSLEAVSKLPLQRRTRVVETDAKVIATDPPDSRAVDCVRVGHKEATYFGLHDEGVAWQTVQRQSEARLTQPDAVPGRGVEESDAEAVSLQVRAGPCVGVAPCGADGPSWRRNDARARVSRAPEHR